MAKKMVFKGKEYEVPDDASLEEINDFLGANKSQPFNPFNQPAKNENVEKFRQMAGTNRGPTDTLRDVLGGLMTGGQNIAALLGEGGQALGNLGARAVTGKWPQNVNIREEMGLGNDRPVDLGEIIGSPNKSLSSQSIKVGSQYAPGMIAGGFSLPGQVISNALYAGTQAQPDQTNLGGYLPSGRPGAMIEGGVAALLPTILGKTLGTVGKGINYFRPGKMANEYAKMNIENLQKEYAQGIKKQDIAYGNFFNPYGEKMVTSSPESFLGLSKDEIKALHPVAKKLRIKFLEEPNADNLHNFQSQVGKDSVKVKEEHLKQLFRDVQSRSQAKLMDFAKTLNDPKALASLKEGIRLTRDVVKPFESTPTMKKIVRKNIKPGDRTFEEVEKAIAKANESGENILDPKTGEVKSKIRGVPDNHYLKSLQDELIKQNKLIKNRTIARNVGYGTAGLVGLTGMEETIRRALSK